MNFISTARKWFANRDIPLLLALLLISANGFGSQLIYQAGVGALFVWMLYASGDWRLRIMWGLGLGIYLFFPALGHSTGLIALLLLCHRKQVEAASLLGAQLLVLTSSDLPIGCLWLNPLCSLAIFLVLYVLLNSWRNELMVISALVIAYACCLLWQSNKSWSLDSVPSAGIGAAINRITNKTSCSIGQLVYLNAKHIEVNSAGALYLDHDARTKYDEGNYFQPRPWSHNALLAGEPFRVAVAMDGALISNLGARCTDSYGHIMYAMMDGASVCPLALNIDDRLVLADSDYVSNALAPYQRNLLRRLAGGDIDMRVYWGILSLSLIVCVIIRSWWIAIPNLVIFMSIMLYPIEGEVRYIGSQCLWPHTTRAGGVTRALQDSGNNVVFGNINTKILVISEGHCATAREKENLVILEPDSSVYIRGIRYEAGNIPLGDVNGIQDARTIYKEGEVCAHGWIRVEGVKIIASGSPACITDKEEAE